jgi:hypothetical protein
VPHTRPHFHVQFAETSLASARGGVVGVFPLPPSLCAGAGAGAAEAPPCGGDERCEGVLRRGEGGEEPPCLFLCRCIGR